MVNKGSNINVKDNHGNTPLIIACFFNNDKIIKLLVEKEQVFSLRFRPNTVFYVV